MKNIVAFAIVFVISVGTHAQDSLSAKQLEKRMKKYHRMKNSGKVILTVGSALTLAGVTTVVKNTHPGIEEGDGYQTGEVLAVGGMVAIGIGVPLALIGSIKGENYRWKLIREIFNEYDSATQQKLFDGQIWIGMTADQVRYSFGKPRKIIAVVTNDSSHQEKWRYKNHELLIVDGTLGSFHVRDKEYREPETTY